MRINSPLAGAGVQPAPHNTPTSTTEIITLHGRCRGEKRVPAAVAQTVELPFPVPLLESMWPGCSLLEHAFGAPRPSAHPLLLGSPCLCLWQPLLGSPCLSWAASADRQTPDRPTDRRTQTDRDRPRQTETNRGRQTDRTVQNSNPIRSTATYKN